MRLSTHYNKASIIVSVLVLFAGAIIYYFAIHKIARNQLDSALSEEIGERIDYVNRYGKIPKKDFDENLTEFSKIGTANYPTRFFDTVYYNSREKTNENGRAIAALIKLNDENYKVIITESYDSIEDLIQMITLITLLLTVILLLILFITNKYLLNDLWKPFYHTLHELKTFNISDTKKLATQTNKVDEFNELNSAVQLMSARVKKDYEHLKHFTENASHEMMTPLAVITAKLDTLIQDETLKPEQYDQINDIYSAAGRLSRLNQSMLLLVKIENNLINDAESLNLHSVIMQKLHQFQELLLAKNIKIIETLQDKNIVASRSLIDILLNNLFSNAIRHNIQSGKINIILTHDKLVFQNPGAAKSLDESLLFERFQKGKGSEGMGIGLTIVKNICQLYNWKISYAHTGLLHSFEITF